MTELAKFDPAQVRDVTIRTSAAAILEAEQYTSKLDEEAKLLLAAIAAEVEQVVSRVGSPAVATDIMGLEQADVFVELKDKARWRPGLDKDALIAQMESLLAASDPGNEAGFTQPIQMRFNELISGVRSDVAVKVYGDEFERKRNDGVSRGGTRHRGAELPGFRPDSQSHHHPARPCAGDGDAPAGIGQAFL